MRFMMMVKSDKSSEAGMPPSQELMAAIGKLTEEMIKSGVLLGSEGSSQVPRARAFGPRAGS